jgi:agmatinase
MSTPRDAPRYTGVRTFAGQRLVTLSEAARADVRAAVVGVPFDTATSWRTGARFGPEAIRSASTLLRPWHPLHEVRALDAGVVDAGDVAITPGNAQRSAEQVAAALGPLCAAGTVPVVLGGDHSVALGELRAHAAAHGPVALALLDAHADTWQDYYGERYFHGTVIRRAADEGVLDPTRSLIAGLRGSLYDARDLDEARELGLELIAIEQLRELSPQDFAARVRDRAGEAPLVLGVDIDVADPSVAPGTGTPEVGGLSASELVALLRALAGIAAVGFDVVEVCPPYDAAAQITSLLAANIAYEMLALAALAARADGSKR